MLLFSLGGQLRCPPPRSKPATPFLRSGGGSCKKLAERRSKLYLLTDRAVATIGAIPKAPLRGTHHLGGTKPPQTPPRRRKLKIWDTLQTSKPCKVP
jgi:hypothetical protein